LSIHMQRVLDQSDVNAIRLLRQATLEANLAPQLASLGQQYEDLASRETRGAFSGMQGEGSVVATLRNMSEMFANLSRTVKGVDGEKKALYDRYKELTAEARKVASDTEAADVREADKIRRNNLAFGRILSEINDVMTRMGEKSSAAYVRVVNQNLGSLTTTSRIDDTTRQKEALVRLELLKEAAVKVVAQISSGQPAGEESKTQTFMMIAPARAVWEYKFDVFYAWAGGIALDAIPTIFIVLLSLGRRTEEEEIEREAVAIAVPRSAPAPRPAPAQAGWPGGRHG
jgi:hypothetical protein